MAAEKALTRQVAIGTSVKAISNGNPNRRYMLIQNDDTTTPAYIGLGNSDIAVNHGIRINHSGGAFEISLTNPFHGPIYAIASASLNLLITEY